MRIVVLGAGGVGGYFGAKLARAGEDVTFVARGAHLAAIRAAGLRVHSTIEGEAVVKVAAVEDTTGLAPADVVLLTVKAYGTEAVLERARAVVGPDTPVITLQNGVQSVEVIDRVFGAGHAVGGAAYIFAVIAAPGVIEHRLLGRIAFGEMDGRRTPRAERVLAALQKAEIPAELSADIRRVMWEKYLLICAQAGMTALARVPAGVAGAAGRRLVHGASVPPGAACQSRPGQIQPRCLATRQRARRFEYGEPSVRPAFDQIA